MKKWQAKKGKESSFVKRVESVGMGKRAATV